jgi:predicted transcriptional regulator
MAEAAYPAFEQSLDESFFKVRHDRATPRELEFMIAMVRCEKLPCSTKAIAEQMQCLLPAVSPLRAQLIHKGFIYSANRGEVDFTVPQFDKFLKRIHGIS